MNVIQPLDLESSYRSFTFKGEHHLVLSFKLYFPLLGQKRSDGSGEREAPILFSDAYKAMADLPQMFIDEGLPKLNPEFFVAGNAIAPNSQTVRSLEISAELNGVRKAIRAIGDRYWVGGVSGTTDPIPFTEMPLTWDKAYGGKEFELNKLGNGIDKVKTDLGEEMVKMPNLEYPNKLLTGLSQRPTPAGTMPIPTDHPLRVKLMGTYDENWLANDFPGYPRDLNLKAFSTGWEDQQLSSPLQGGERYQLSHMHPDHSVIEGTIPNYRVRSFLVKSGLEYSDITPVDMQELTPEIDTVVFFPNQEMGMLIYRATVKSENLDGSDFKHMMAAFEDGDHPARNKEHYHNSLVGRLHPDLNTQFALTTKDLIPDNVPCGMARLTQQDVEPKQLLAENIQNRMEETTAEAKATVEQQLNDVIADLQSKGIDSADVEKKLADLKAGKVEKDEWQLKFEAVLEKIIPGATNPDGKLDLQKIDFRAFDELSKLSEEHAAFQKQKTKDQLEQQMKELAENGMEEAASKLQESLVKIDLPPEFPRPINPEKVLDQLRESERAVIAQNEVLMAQGQPLLELPDLIEIEEKLVESAQSSKESYRLGAHMMEDGRAPLLDQRQELQAYADSLIEQGKSLSGLDLAGLDFSNRNLANVDFSDCFLEKCNFENSDLRKANFENAIAAHGNFSKANLSESNLAKANIGSCSFVESNLSDAVTNGSEWARSDFTSATLANNELIGTANTLEVTFKKASLTNVKFEQVTFIETSFSGASFSNTYLESATFNQCNLTGCQFIKSNLEGVNFIEANLSNALFDRCDMKNSRFVNETKLNESKFVNTKSQDSCFRGANLERAEFINANISNCDFGDVNAKHCRLDGSDARHSIFMNTDFTFADLSNANFMESNFMQSILTEAKLRKSNCYGAEFMSATVGKTDFGGANLDGTKLENWRPSKWQ